MNNKCIGIANNETFYTNKDSTASEVCPNLSHTKISDVSREFRE